MNRSSLAFTEEGDDPLFLETVAGQHDSGLTLEALEAVWKSAFEHFSIMAEFCPDFPDKFEKGDIVDERMPATSFYPMAISRTKWAAGQYPVYVAEGHRRLAMNTMSPDEIIAWNASINAMIAAEKADIIQRRSNAF